MHKISFLCSLYNRTSGGPVDAGPEYQQDLDKELFKLKQMFGKGDMNTFPTFKFEGKSGPKLSLGDDCRWRIFMYSFGGRSCEGPA